MKFYGKGMPGVDKKETYSGKLIVIEGTDGVGRSTQIELLKTWLEAQGHAVIDTGMTRSNLAGTGLKDAKSGTTLGGLTMQLFYATDFADRMEHEILPALKAGFIVLTDRYFYSSMARAMVRGLNPHWLRGMYGFALVPDAVFYLRIDSAEELCPRVLQSGRGFDYWESGMDLHMGEDFYDSFIAYQTKLLQQFDQMSAEYGFHVVDASRQIRPIAADLRRAVQKVIGDKTSGKAAVKSDIEREGVVIREATT